MKFMKAPSRASYSKYSRPTVAPGLRMTPDDEQILLEVYRHDVIDANTIYALLAPRTPNKIRRRLLKLHQAGYLRRLPQLEEIYVSGGGSLPIAYTLDRSGQTYVEGFFGLRPKKKRIRERASRLSASFILHSLEQARFMVSLRRSVELRDDCRFLYPEDIYRYFAPEILNRDQLPYGIRTRVRWYDYRETQGTNPDGFFMLFFPGEPEGRQRRSIFLEIDRGTETVNPSDKQVRGLKFWERTSILRKFVVYAAAHERGVHEKEFGIPTFQVLTITTNPGRVREMQRMYRERLSGKPHRVNPNRFLFTDWESMEKHGADLVTMPVENAAEETRSLLI